MNSIEIKNLTKNFGSFYAVDNISFNVKRGEIYGFLGPNGSGKSTTIRMLCGLLSASKGTATVAGFDINKNPEGVKSKIGYMSQRFSLYNDLTVDQNLDFWGTLYKLNSHELIQRKKEIYELANIGEVGDRLTGTLSGGWKQRLALGCSIIHKPEIVFLDEPTGGVDPISRRGFWELIDKLSANGTTVFVTTHFLDEAEYCHNIGLIYNGKLIALGSPNDLKTKSMTQKSIEVVSSSPMDALSILTDHDLIDETSIFGTKIHAILKEGTDLNVETENSIRKLLSEKNIQTQSISEITPSLEDVFIHLIEKNG